MYMQKVKVKGQGHRVQNKFCPKLGISGLMAMKWCTKLEVA